MPGKNFVSCGAKVGAIMASIAEPHALVGDSAPDLRQSVWNDSDNEVIIPLL